MATCGARAAAGVKVSTGKRRELDEFFKAHPLVPVLAQPLPAGMTTLEGYARRTGQPVDQVKARAARSRWPDFSGRCGRLKRKAAGNSESVYRAGELDKFFKAHPLVPVLAQPLPAGLTTLDRYAERARRPAAPYWNMRPGFPAAVGRLARPGGGRLVYQEAAIEKYVASQPGLNKRPPLDLAGRNPDERTSPRRSARTSRIRRPRCCLIFAAAGRTASPRPGQTAVTGSVTWPGSSTPS